MVESAKREGGGVYNVLLNPFLFFVFKHTHRISVLECRDSS